MLDPHGCIIMQIKNYIERYVDNAVGDGFETRFSQGHRFFSDFYNIYTSFSLDTKMFTTVAIDIVN